MEINYTLLKKWTLSYATLPLLIFLLFWLRPLLALPLSGLLIYALWLSAFKGISDKKALCSNKKLLICLILIALVWCYLAGLGGMYYQSLDHHWRNAIFRDLINYDWPVRYASQDAVLIYYIGFWLPAALIAKLSLWFGTNPDGAFVIGNIALLIYSVIGIVLLMLNLIYALNAKSLKKVAAVILLLVFFSGLDIIGAVFKTDMVGVHLEWWADYFQFSSLTTDLFWVYNQTIIAWLMVMMFYNQQQEKDFAFWALLCFFCSPLPAIGLVIYMIIIAVQNFFKAVDEDKIRAFCQDIFSRQNIIATFIILPIILLYMTSNATIEGNNMQLIFNRAWPLQILYLPVFWLLEFGIYALLIAPNYADNRLFKITIWSLLIIPLVIIGPIADVSMRCSIPAILILMIMTANYLFNNWQDKTQRLRIVFLVMALMIGAITPATEFYRGFVAVAKSGKLMLAADNVKTFEGSFFYLPERNALNNSNFGTINANERFFYKYLAKLKN